MSGAVPQPHQCEMLKYSTEAQAVLAKHTADKYLPNPNTTVLPPNQLVQQPSKPQGPIRMSKLNELAAALNDIPKQIEADASSALARLVGAKEKAATATQKIHNVAANVEETVKAIDDFANQITNGGPPL